MAYKPIACYGIIGDLQLSRWSGSDGSIDFMSVPRFDSPTIFAALLDHRMAAISCCLQPSTHARQKQMYLPDSNILLSRFLSDGGVAEVSDFMPVAEVGNPHTLIPPGDDGPRRSDIQDGMRPPFRLRSSWTSNRAKG